MPTISSKGRHFQYDMTLQSIRWYLASSLSYRDIDELMAERGFSVDHSTINRWVVHYSPQLVIKGEDKRGRKSFLIVFVVVSSDEHGVT
jgi:transposase-like protein